MCECVRVCTSVCRSDVLGQHFGSLHVLPSMGVTVNLEVSALMCMQNSWL